jgi:hypothetical protein
MNVHEMLLAYQTINETRLTKIHLLLGDENFSPIKQLIEPPDAELPSKVPTLQPEHYRKITPFLKARFEYAGAWKEADAGHEWLGLKQMETVLREASVLEQIRARSEIWSDSPLVQMPPSRISLFGLYRDQAEEIYLIWPAVDGDEPEILSYGGNYESRFSDFAQYLKYLIDG